MSGTLELQFGALAPEFYLQLRAQGVLTTKASLKHIQRDADALTRLCVRGLIGEAEAKRIRCKITRTVEAGEWQKRIKRRTGAAHARA